jgi:hypothetical protein
MTDAPRYVYLVGACRSKFVVDRVFLDEEEAGRCCDGCRNNKYAWAVNKMRIGGYWGDRETVYRVERTGT